MGITRHREDRAEIQIKRAMGEQPILDAERGERAGVCDLFQGRLVRLIASDKAPARMDRRPNAQTN